MNDLERAKLEEPEGKICGFCNKENNFVDDCGFWYILNKDKPLERKSYAACKECFNIHYSFHVSICGQGDR